MTTVSRIPIPGPDQLLRLIGVLRRMDTDILAEFDRLFEEYGDTIALKFGGALKLDGSMGIFTRNPAHIREMLVTKSDHMRKDTHPGEVSHDITRFIGQGLLTSDGDYWKRHRKMMAPVFHARRIGEYAGWIVDHTLEQLGDWQDGAIRNTAHDMTELTLGIVTRTLFNVDMKADAARVEAILSVMQEAGSQQSLFPAWLPTPRERKMRAAIQAQDDLIYRLIAQRRANPQDAGDLLSMLLNVEYDDGARMSDAQLRDEIATFILAGHETTANTLNWTWMLLAQHPHVLAKLQTEVDTVLNGERPTMESLSQLPYTNAVIDEAMRLYPAVWSVNRCATQDTQIGNYDIPKDTFIMAMFYHAHRHPDYWTRPLDFYPERFAQGEPTDRYAYTPFGGGPRICIGNNFAIMEARLILATIVQRFELLLPDSSPVVPVPRITLYPKNGLPMRLKRRANVLV